jgi:hypothetical protein
VPPVWEMENGIFCTQKERTMRITEAQQAVMDYVTSRLAGMNDANEIPSDLAIEIKRFNDVLKLDGLQLKVTRVNDGIQKGWVIQFERA